MTRISSILGYFIHYFLVFSDGKELRGCSHDDVPFKHGEHFIPHYADLMPDLPGQCMQCNCNDGVVYCENLTCSDLRCDDDFYRGQPCCKQCPHSESLTERISEIERISDLQFSAPKPNKTRRKGDCSSDGKVYKEGSSWQPTIGPLGAMSCVQCACVNAQISCKRYPCRELPCSHPRKQFGHCCPVCPVLETLTESSVQCLPRSSEVFVFKRPKMGKTAQIIEYGFIQSSSRNKIDLHTWDTSLKDHKFSATHLPVSMLSNRNLTIAGSTSRKHWSRFVKRENILKSRCNTNCAERIIRLEGTLKLYPAAPRVRCRSDEMDTTTL